MIPLKSILLPCVKHCRDCSRSYSELEEISNLLALRIVDKVQSQMIGSGGNSGSSSTIGSTTSVNYTSPGRLIPASALSSRSSNQLNDEQIEKDEEEDGQEYEDLDRNNYEDIGNIDEDELEESGSNAGNHQSDLQDENQSNASAGTKSTGVERRQSGRAYVRRNYAADSVGAEYFSESDDEAKPSSNQTSHISQVSSMVYQSVVPLQKYFMERLYQVIYLLQGTEELLSGWKVQIIPNDRGLLSGFIDIIYISNRGRRYRNRVDVACALGLMVAAKSSKSMSREQMYLVAMETREKHLISQLIGAAGGLCDEVQYISDNATIVYDGKVIGNVLSPAINPHQILSNPALLEEANANVYFSFGNVTVLSWGSIVSDPAFHTSTQIYPIGFKCIRQEHDVSLDKVVECLCEIDKVEEDNPLTKEKSVFPLFRLSIAWVMSNGSREVRVYEAKSPQQTWQAAMLETEGVDLSSQAVEGNLSSIVRDYVPNHDTKPIESDVISGDEGKTDVQSFESMDEEEISLRNQICEERRKYFRALRLEQKQGLQAAVVPRLSLDNVESFADEGIMRLIEGMQNALDCVQYQFVDSREQESGRRNVLRGFGTVNDKLKNLHKVARKSNQPHLLLSADGFASGAMVMGPSILTKRKGGPTGGGSGINGGLAVPGAEGAFSSTNDIRKKIRQDIREQRVHSSTVQKTRNTYVKRLESHVSNIRNNLTKIMRRRRDEIKYIIGGISDQEYQLSRNIHIQNSFHDSSAGSLSYVPDQLELDEHTPLPEPLNGIIHLDGSILGDILEIWDYLQTFSDALDLNAMNFSSLLTDTPFESFSDSKSSAPDLMLLFNVFKRYDPYFKRLTDLTAGMFKSLDYVRGDWHGGRKLTEFEFPQDLAENVVNAIGIALSKVLLKEYEHIMGIELAKESIGSNKVIVNALTWREIARTVLISVCGREIGISETDLASSLKGRGYFCTPETADKKALRLCRKRILHQYQLRHEIQESMFGFQAGICVRLPCPSHYSLSSISASIVTAIPSGQKRLWWELLLELRCVPISFGWLIRDYLYAVSYLCPDDDVKRTLEECLMKTFDAKETARIKEAVLDCLSKYLDRMRILPHSIGDEPLGSYGSDVIDYQFPTTGWDLMRAQFRYQYLHAKSEYVNQRVAGEGMEEEEIGDYDIGGDKGEDSDDDDLNADVPDNRRQSSDEKSVANRTNEGEPMDQDSNYVAESAERPFNDEIERDKSFAEDSINGSGFDSSLNRPSLQASQQRIAKPGVFLSKIPQNILAALEYDPIDYDKLSIAMQRCHNALIEFMRHYLAQPFILPVDQKTVAGYYNYISQPISLSEIQQHLIKGQYEDSVFKVYADVMILLENSVAFNPESSPIHQSALKLVVIFERMFFEMVLTWNSSIPTSACCHICRQQSAPQYAQSYSLQPSGTSTTSLDAISDTIGRSMSQSPDLTAYQKIMVCERCEAAYHVGCIDPPISIAPRTDWYCSGCTENRSIAAIHPNKLTKVQHPSRSGLRGQVVGIEQIRQTAQFVVEFDDHSREMWTGAKVRVNVAPGETEDFGVPTLPPGYNYDDYDAVCGLVRGYAGWGSFHSLVPPYLSDSHSFYARKRSLTDPFFHKSRLAIAWLGSSLLTPEDIGIKELTTIFRAIAQRTMSTPALVAALAKQDESNGEALATCAENIAKGNISFANLIRKLQTDTTDETNLTDLFEARENVDGKIDDPNVDSDDDIVRGDEDELLDDLKEDKTQRGVTKAAPPSMKDEPAETTKALSMEDKDEADEAIPAAVINEWEHRRLSRRRGREDALASHAILQEVLREVDLEGRLELSEVGPIVSQTVGDFYTSAVPAIVKVCTVKPHEDLNVEEWCRGYQSKVAEFQSMDTAMIDRPLLCGYCGQDEFSVCSSFVWGQTWSEFIEDKLIAKDNEKRKNVPSDGRPTKRRGRYAKLLAARALLWKPCYEPDALIEQMEGEAVDREFIEGSLPVHECCAEMMETCRATLLQRSQRTEGHRVADIIAGIGRGKTTSLGRDRDGNSYWVFCGLQGVFVCSESVGLDIPSAASVAAKDMEIALNHRLIHESAVPATGSWNVDKVVDGLRFRNKNVWSYYDTDFKTFPDGESLLEGDQDDKHSKHNKKTIWRLYLPTEDIAQIVGRLDKRHLQERTLLQALSLLFPTALDAALKMKSCKAPTDPTDMDAHEEKPSDDQQGDVRAADTETAKEAVEGAGEGTEMDLGQAVLDPPLCEENSVDDRTRPVMEEDEDDASIIFATDRRRGRPPKSHSDSHSVHEEAVAFHSTHNSLFKYVNVPKLKLSRGDWNAGEILNVGDEVVVEGGNDLVWTAKIIDVRLKSEVGTETVHYKVSFDQWGEAYDAWIAPSRVKLLSSMNHLERVPSADDSNEAPGAQPTPASSSRFPAVAPLDEAHYLQSVRQVFYQDNVLQGPGLLRSLRAYVYGCAPHRHAPNRPKINFSSATTSIEILRVGLLMIEEALPVGAVDDSEDRWGDDFVEAWRESVAAANDASSLMQCMVMLEYGVRTAWLIPSGLRLMSCLPSRIHCLRNATIGLVAMKLWTLDQSVKYDKVNYPKTHPGAVHNTVTASSKARSSSGGHGGGTQNQFGSANLKSKRKQVV